MRGFNRLRRPEPGTNRFASASKPSEVVEVNAASENDACTDGGTIVLVAECSEGLGRPDFMKWFEAADSRALAARLRSEYEVNGQTAWALLSKAERYRICLISQLPDEQVKQMRMTPVRSIASAIEQNAQGFVMPRGAAVLPRVETWN